MKHITTVIDAEVGGKLRADVICLCGWHRELVEVDDFTRSDVERSKRELPIMHEYDHNPDSPFYESDFPNGEQEL